MLPIMSKVKKRYIENTIEFNGYNASEHKDKGEMPDMLNLCSNNYPCASPRPSREVIATLVKPNGLISANGKLAYVDGTSFKYDGTSKGTVTDGMKHMVDFQDKILIFPDKKIYNPADDTFADIGNAAVYPAEGSCPDIDYATVLNNRVWACKGNHIYASKLGDCTNWTSLGTSAIDSFSVDVASEGDFTGIATYMNHVCFFKEDLIHELYGDKPSNFQVQDGPKKGALSQNSIIEVNNMLFHLWRDGINVYQGGQPIPISSNMNKKYVSGSAGSDGRKYYMSLYDGAAYTLFVYDSLYKMWHKEDSLNVVQFASLDGYVYALCADGKLLKFNSGNEAVQWEVYTQVLTERYQGKKGYSDLSFRLDLESGSAVMVYVSYNSGDFNLVKHYEARGLSSLTIPLKIERADHFQIKISGRGKGKLYQIDRKFFLGSDR